MYGVAPDSLASAVTRSTVASGQLQRGCAANASSSESQSRWAPGSSSGSGGFAITERQ